MGLHRTLAMAPKYWSLVQSRDPFVAGSRNKVDVLVGKFLVAVVDAEQV